MKKNIYFNWPKQPMVLIALFLGFVILLGCTSTGQALADNSMDSEPPAILKVTVLNEEQEPVPWALVELILGDETRTVEQTGEDGIATFEVSKSLAGVEKIRADAIGYQLATDYVSTALTRGETKEETLILQTELTGEASLLVTTVRKAQGSSGAKTAILNNANVILAQSLLNDPAILVGIRSGTTQNGSVRFEGLVSGRMYVAYATLKSYVPAREKKVLPSGKLSDSVQVQLKLVNEVCSGILGQEACKRNAYCVWNVAENVCKGSRRNV